MQTVGLTDPKILFDPTAGSNGMYYVTFMVCQGGGCSGSSWSQMGISLAVTSNPLGSWTVYDYLNVSTTDLQDQEKLGFSGDKITFAVNDYGCKCGSGAQYKQENVAVMQKSDAVAGDTPRLRRRELRVQLHAGPRVRLDADDADQLEHVGQHPVRDLEPDQNLEQPDRDHADHGHA